MTKILGIAGFVIMQLDFFIRIGRHRVILKASEYPAARRFRGTKFTKKTTLQLLYVRKFPIFAA